jgi:hypothetical protein
MVYVPKTWRGKTEPSPTPITADALNAIEAGIAATATVADAAETPAGAQAKATAASTAEASARATSLALKLDTTVASATYVPKTAAKVATNAESVLLRTFADAARGPAVLSIAENLFSTVKDPTLYVGMNLNANGVLVNSGESVGFALGFEEHYNDGSANPKAEMYLQWTKAGGASYVRPFFSQFDKTTQKVTSVSITGSDETNTGSGGAQVVFYGGNASVGQWLTATLTNNSFVVRSVGTAAETILTVQGATGRAGLLYLGFNGDNSFARLSPISSGMAVQIAGAGPAGENVAYFYKAPIGAPGAAFAVGVNDNEAAGTFAVGTSDVSVKGLVARGRALQTGSIFEAQISDKTPVTRIDKAGTLMTRRASAPVLADMVDGEIALHSDASGNLKLTSRVGGVLTTKTVTAA